MHLQAGPLAVQVRRLCRTANVLVLEGFVRLPGLVRVPAPVQQRKAEHHPCLKYRHQGTLDAKGSPGSCPASTRAHDSQRENPGAWYGT